jgi:hypothetical protein
MPTIRPLLAGALFALTLCTRGQYAVTNAYADWSLCFDDPTTLDLTDVNSLTVKAVPYGDPMDEIGLNLLLELRPLGGVFATVTCPAGSRRPEPSRPRAPPLPNLLSSVDLGSKPFHQGECND